MDLLRQPWKAALELNSRSGETNVAGASDLARPGSLTGRFWVSGRRKIKGAGKHPSCQPTTNLNSFKKHC